jgi:hypothetical protein
MRIVAEGETAIFAADSLQRPDRALVPAGIAAG